MSPVTFSINSINVSILHINVLLFHGFNTTSTSNTRNHNFKHNIDTPKFSLMPIHSSNQNVNINTLYENVSIFSGFKSLIQFQMYTYKISIPIFICANFNDNIIVSVIQSSIPIHRCNVLICHQKHQLLCQSKFSTNFNISSSWLKRWKCWTLYIVRWHIKSQLEIGLIIELLNQRYQY